MGNLLRFYSGRCRIKLKECLRDTIDGTGTGIGAGNYDRLIVSGAGHTFTAGGQLVVNLRGISGSAFNNFVPSVGQRFNVIHTDAGVTGSFAGLTQPSSGLPAGTRIDTIYSATDMDLVVPRPPMPTWRRWAWSIPQTARAWAWRSTAIAWPPACA